MSNNQNNDVSALEKIDQFFALGNFSHFLFKSFVLIITFWIFYHIQQEILKQQNYS